MKAAQRTFDPIDELPANKAKTVAEKNFNMSQVIQSKATQITYNSPEDLARQLFAYLLREMPYIAPEKAEEFVRELYPEAKELKLLGDGKRERDWEVGKLLFQTKWFEQ